MHLDEVPALLPPQSGVCHWHKIPDGKCQQHNRKEGNALICCSYPPFKWQKFCMLKKNQPVFPWHHSGWVLMLSLNATTMYMDVQLNFSFHRSNAQLCTPFFTLFPLIIILKSFSIFMPFRWLNSSVLLSEVPCSILWGQTDLKQLKIRGLPRIYCFSPHLVHV